MKERIGAAFVQPFSIKQLRRKQQKGHKNNPKVPDKNIQNFGVYDVGMSIRNLGKISSILHVHETIYCPAALPSCRTCHNRGILPQSLNGNPEKHRSALSSAQTGAFPDFAIP